MRREVQAFVVNCTFKDDGCQWKGEVRHLEVIHGHTKIPKICENITIRKQTKASVLWYISFFRLYREKKTEQNQFLVLCVWSFN